MQYLGVSLASDNIQCTKKNTYTKAKVYIRYKQRVKLTNLLHSRTRNLHLAFGFLKESRSFFAAHGASNGRKTQQKKDSFRWRNSQPKIRISHGIILELKRYVSLLFANEIRFFRFFFQILSNLFFFDCL